VSYIVAEINGMLALEIYFFLDRFRGELFLKLFWGTYIVRLASLVIFVFTYAYINRDVKVSFFVSFLAYYFMWLYSEIYILVKVAEKKKVK
jgi:hypothetical protein